MEVPFGGMFADEETPTLHHMNEPPLVWYTIMRTDSHDLEASAHYMVDHFQARTDTDADTKMRRKIQDFRPGIYWVTRSVDVDGITVVRAN